MCGIVAYIGDKEACPILIDGLKRLEYRGYDSAGVAIANNGEILIKKRAGKIADLEASFEGEGFPGTVGIGHTRWATHGPPNEINAHPHVDCSGKFTVIHNGIIENYQSLRAELERKGHEFSTETDTETLAHLLEEFYGGDVEMALRMALSQVQGTYGMVVMSKDHPGLILAARKGSPLVVGMGEGEYFVASDVSAIIKHTKNVTFLDDEEIAVISREGMTAITIGAEPVEKKVEVIAMDLEEIEKGGYDHFMLKEIMEQPETMRNTVRGRLIPDQGTARLGGLRYELESLLYARRILLTACGTSWHAALIGEYMLEEFVRIPVEVEYASEFRYRDPILDGDSVVAVISQSGETADTLAALREAHNKGAKVLGICNVVGSSIARESDAGVYLHAGPEIGVASTKAFTSQVTIFALLALVLARMRAMAAGKGREIAEELIRIPEKVQRILSHCDAVKEIAEKFQNAPNFLYLGRGYNFPVALEGALKLKEISYIHAEGYPAAEMKHGPIALIDENMPVVVIATRDSSYGKIISNIEEVKARSGKVIAIATEGDTNLRELADHVIYIPETLDMLTPLLSVIPLQLLAYHIAILRGCDVDQPRNLAKSVTVE